MLFRDSYIKGISEVAGGTMRHALDEKGNRAIDKVKARLCVDGRGQDRADYHITDIESPTANVASIFTIAQIAASEERFIMVGEVGTAYLNANMPSVGMLAFR